MTIRHQRGVVFIAFAALMIGLFATLATGLIGLNASRKLAHTESDQILRSTRAMVLAHLAQPDLHDAAGRLGQFSVLPDLPIAAGSGADAVEPSFDGLGETTGCASRLWISGQALAPAAASGADARCFGRLAWKTLGLPVTESDAADQAGRIPWLIASPNLFVGAGCLRNLNPMMMGQIFTGFSCPSNHPYPWLTVVDARGNVLSDRVAFAIVMPGPALPGQVRSATAGPAAYLDSIAIQAGCQVPCRPGTYNNALFTHPNNQPWVLIKAPDGGPLVSRDNTYLAPVHFNDRLTYVTAHELFAKMQATALRIGTRELDSFHALRGYYPFAARLESADAACDTGSRFGHLPATPGSCIGDHLNLPTVFTAAGWHRYFAYAVSARCISSNTNCDAPGLSVDGNNAINALILAPGQPRVTAPFVASLGSAQQPLSASGALSSFAADWLDSVENAGGTPDVFQTSSAPSETDNDLMFPIK